MEATLENLLDLAVVEASGARAPVVAPAHVFIAACKLEAPLLSRALREAGVDVTRLRRRARALAVRRDVPEGTGPEGIAPEVRAALKGKGAAGPIADPDAAVLAVLHTPDEPISRALAEAGSSPAALAKAMEAARAEGGAAARARGGPVAARGGGPAARSGDARGGAGREAEGDAQPDSRRAAPPQDGGAPAPKAAPSKTPLLDKLGRDLSALAREGKLEPVIGRQREMKQVVRILLRKTKSNAVLVGEAGVGKTAIVEGLAQIAVDDEAPVDLRDLRFVELPLGSLVAGTKYRGDFEERLQKIIDEAASDPKIVLFLDEVHLLVGAGDKSGGMDAANLLKPALARGALRVVGATTIDEYRTSIEKDPALERRFSPVRVEEPTPEEARAILEKVADGLSRHHGLTFDPDAIEASIELSIRYLPDRRLPDKARDLLDQAAAAARFSTFSVKPGGAAAGATIGRDAIARIVAEWTGVPAERFTDDARARLANLDEALAQRVLGQDDAVRSVAEVVRTGLAGLVKAGRPRGSMMFVGPTGVGKTELAKALAEQLFGDESAALLRFDMSEYQDRYTAQRLTGAPPGYVGHEEGGQLVNAVRRTPYAVVLFDEVEKADPQVLDLFLQILDDGRLTDSHGKVADFSNTFVILTSNLLQRAAPARKGKQVGFALPREEGGAAAPADERLEPRADDELRRALSQKLRPELVGRIQRVVDFLPLGASNLAGIAAKTLRQLAQRAAADAGVTLQWDDDVPRAIVRAVDRPELGARAIERLVEASVARPLADAIVAGTAARGATVRVVVASEGGARLDLP